MDNLRKENYNNKEERMRQAGGVIWEEKKEEELRKEMRKAEEDKSRTEIVFKVCYEKYMKKLIEIDRKRGKIKGKEEIDKTLGKVKKIGENMKKMGEDMIKEMIGNIREIDRIREKGRKTETYTYILKNVVASH